MDIRIPHLGEGADSGTIVNIYVKEGDKVAKDQTILELENEKAVAPIPSPLAGTVKKILVKVGDKVTVGQAIVTLDGAAGAAAPPAGPRPVEKQAVPSPAPAPAAVPSGSGYVYHSPSGAPPPAAPSVRKVARELGIDLALVRGSQAGGRIVMEDLRAYIQALQAGSAAKTAAAAKPSPERVDFSKWGPVTRKPVSSLRQKIGQKMTESWTSVPHVTQFDEADITELMTIRKKHAEAYEKKGAKLTITPFLIKAAVSALKKYPSFNASLDEASHEIILKSYYHIGVAVDTEAGLIVPVLRDADKKSLLEIAKSLEELADKTRSRKVTVDELKGGTFTISNLGSIGGTHFTPIVNAPEVAILGVGRGAMKPVLKEKNFEARLLLPLALSYDHRAVDGADGARFIREVVEALERFKESDVKL